MNFIKTCEDIFMNQFPYTKKNRIADVLKLIQYLGLDDTARNYAVKTPTVQKDLGKPASNSNWLEIAKQHSELFRVTEKDSVALIIRTLKRDSTKNICSEEEIKMLIDMALELYKIQIEHSRAWKFWLPALGAFIGLLISTIFLGLLKA